MPITESNGMRLGLLFVGLLAQALLGSEFFSTYFIIHLSSYEVIYLPKITHRAYSRCCRLLRDRRTLLQCPLFGSYLWTGQPRVEQESCRSVVKKGPSQMNFYRIPPYFVHFLTFYLFSYLPVFKQIYPASM